MNGSVAEQGCPLAYPRCCRETLSLTARSLQVGVRWEFTLVEIELSFCVARDVPPQIIATVLTLPQPEIAPNHLVPPLTGDPPQPRIDPESAPPLPVHSTESVAHQADLGGSDGADTRNLPSSTTTAQPPLGSLEPDVADPTAADEPQLLHVASEGKQGRNSSPKISPDRLEALPAEGNPPGEVASPSEPHGSVHIVTATPEQGVQGHLTAQEPREARSEGTSPAAGPLSNGVAAVDPPDPTQQPRGVPAAGWGGVGLATDDAHLRQEATEQPPTSAAAPEPASGSRPVASPAPPPIEGPPPTAANVVEAIANLAAAYGPGGYQQGAELPADLAAYLPPGYGHLMTHPAMAQAVHQGGYAPFGQQYQGGAQAGDGGAMGLGSSQMHPGAVDGGHSTQTGRNRISAQGSLVTALT